jgi:cyclopropane-fatty-acyl-phospholipid synthase
MTYLTRRIASDFLATCERMETGRLRVRTPEGHVHDFGAGGTEAELQINNWAGVTALLARGDIGFGEGYVAGLWDTPSIEAIVELGLLNEEPMRRYAFPSAWNGLVFRAVDRIVRRNSLGGSRRNIPAHYDVGNEFYGE